MSNTITPGKAFFNKQVAFLEANDVEGLIANQYAADAELVGFDFEVKGREALRIHFTKYLANLGAIKLVSIDKFFETDDTIFFEATIDVRAGQARVYDAFVLQKSKATYHFTGLLGFSPRA